MAVVALAEVDFAAGRVRDVAPRAPARFAAGPAVPERPLGADFFFAGFFSGRGFDLRQAVPLRHRADRQRLGLLRLVRVLRPRVHHQLAGHRRPRRFFGSMPLTAFSTTNCGRSAMRREYPTAVSPPGYPEWR